jgi:hypothetical protein
MIKPHGLALAIAVLLVPLSATAQINRGQHLNTTGQTKVNKALAKGYLQNGAGEMQKNQTQVNIGSKKAGTCTMNVGTTPAGQKGSKETIVTAKEIINVCK